ncbi:MAG TPA: regulator, partial [Rhodothermales bacterium]|nr:regulator [Rhodothermales bacterium]
MLLCWSARSASAQVGSWRSYTSMREVTALSASGDAVWVGTTGGIYRYTTATGEIKRYTNIEGLHAPDVAALTFDAGCGAAGCVWIGYDDGVIDRLDVDAGAVTTFRDLQRADRYPSRTINRMVLNGDSLLIATAFGLVVFDKSRSEVRDTYDQIGNAPPAMPIYDATVAEGPDGGAALWLATEQGVGYAYLRSPNLKDPAAWTVETSGLPSPQVLSLAAFQNVLYVGTALGPARRDAGGTYTALPVTDWPVLSLESTPEGLLGLDQFAVLVMDGNGAFSRFPLPGVENPVDVALTGDTVWVGDRAVGLVPARLDRNGPPKLTALQDCQVAQNTCYPAGPYSGIFVDLDVDGMGNLWAAGVSEAGSGFHRLDLEGEWTDFTGAAMPLLQGRSSFTRVYAAPDGNLWAASEGNGLVQVTPDGEVTVYTRDNSTLRASEGIS